MIEVPGSSGDFLIGLFNFQMSAFRQGVASDIAHTKYYF